MATTEEMRAKLIAIAERGERERREREDRVARIADSHRAAHPPGGDACLEVAMEALDAVLAVVRSDGYAGGPFADDCVRVLSVAGDALQGVEAMRSAREK